MAKPPKAFDVWFVAANTVYKAVPYNVVADWTQQGRLARTDMVRPAGTAEAWVAIADYELLADYLPRATHAKLTHPAARGRTCPRGVTPAAVAAAPAAEEAVELPDPEARPGRSRSRTTTTST